MTSHHRTPTAAATTPRPAIAKSAVHRRGTLYRGEHACSQCADRAHYMQACEPRCERHADVAHRIAMRFNPIIARSHELKVLELYDAARADTRGRVELLPMHMFGRLPQKRGFFTVLPNIGAGRTQFPSLEEPDFVVRLRAFSPMVLGPIEHREPGLPPALLLENWYQARKAFRSELARVGDRDVLLPAFAERREQLYLDPVPRRHKLGLTKAAHLKAAGHVPGSGGTNVCRFSVFRNRHTGVDKRYSYIEARMFYCSWYEHLVRQHHEWPALLAMHLSRRSLLIAGPDARTVVDTPLTAERLVAWYADETLPFGHEMVLATMLIMHATPERQPWRQAWLAEFGETFDAYYQPEQPHGAQ